MTSLDAISFDDLVRATTPKSVNKPEQSVDNIDPNDRSQVDRYIMVTAEALSRFYNGLSLIYQSFKGVMHNEETPGLMKIAIQQNLLTPLSRVFPEFVDFEFEITSSGSIIGHSDNANTILNALVRVSQAPVDMHDTLPEHKQVVQDMIVGSALEFDDFDEDEDKDDDWDEH